LIQLQAGIQIASLKYQVDVSASGVGLDGEVS